MKQWGTIYRVKSPVLGCTISRAEGAGPQETRKGSHLRAEGKCVAKIGVECRIEGWKEGRAAMFI